MGTNNIKSCRVCKSDKLGEAFGIDNKMYFVFCKFCHTLQRKDDTPYQIDFNFEGRQLEVDYYPAFLLNHDTAPLSKGCVFFSLFSIEYILEKMGYEIIEINLIGYRLYVAFQPLSKLKRLRSKEKKMKLDNQFTFMLWAMQFKK